MTEQESHWQGEEEDPAPAWERGQGSGWQEEEQGPAPAWERGQGSYWQEEEEGPATERERGQGSHWQEEEEGPTTERERGQGSGWQAEEQGSAPAWERGQGSYWQEEEEGPTTERERGQGSPWQEEEQGSATAWERGQGSHWQVEEEGPATVWEHGQGSRWQEEEQGPATAWDRGQALPWQEEEGPATAWDRGQGAHWQEEEEGPATEREPDHGVPGRLSITAVPARRGSPRRQRLIKVTLVLVGVLTLGMIAYAEWLALRPVPDSTAAFRATASELLTATLAQSGSPGLPGVATGAPASTATPTITPTPQPSRTPVPLVTRTPRVKPTASQPLLTPPVSPVPRLVEPADGATLVDRASFRWEWAAAPLAANQAFDLRIWSAQEEQAGRPRRGAVAPTRDTQVEVDLRYVPAIQEYGPGDYFWTVVVVEFGADGSPKVIGQWGEAWRFVYR